MLIFSLILTIFAVGCKKEEENNTTNNGNNTENPGGTVNPTPPADENTVKDIDGNIYKTVNINGKTWMAENLKVEKLNDNTPLKKFTTTREWWEEANSTPNGACGYYNNDGANKDKYGALYDMQAALSGKLCPSGWHVASKSEWDALIAYAGGKREATSTKLRAVNGWTNSNNNAVAGTDNFGFAAKPAGQFSASNMNFYGLNTLASWWTSDENEAIIRVSNIFVGRDNWTDGLKEYDGNSVRCVKN